MSHKKELKDFLDEKVSKYNTKDFIESDPISIPHNFSKKEDIEISAFLASTIAWGNRKIIVRNSNKMIELMDNSPHDFVINSSEKDLIKLQDFKHRTFNGNDFGFFIKSLKNIYKNHDGLEDLFQIKESENDVYSAISRFREVFFSIEHEKRVGKHISNPFKKSACKRINMFLRWMVRNDGVVDFGIWKNISPSILSIPLDVHSSNISRKLGLLDRKQNDLRAVVELDYNLKKLDKNDPTKYDFALFGLGIFEKF